ncbi:protein kinase C and casein kinase substrate in neurons protein 3 isoform X1 [Erpetoichthys calabaricus]|uniref:protein kinase C and casein kinase substrate in neurons protein 3 isoform X1 n=2 Tax=Erpetoichthys calabaricus TaxID=27687 RepID=UPI0022344FEA|nr:protein kinase C and casein kinase substrate in neurons protein 3 isoform X1 [Erpetoichthys calabaricus]
MLHLPPLFFSHMFLYSPSVCHLRHILFLDSLEAVTILCCKDGPGMSPAGETGNRGSNESFWEPGNYKSTVKRTDDGYRLCNELVACFQERARIEKKYAQQLSEWSNKWRTAIGKGPQYGTLEKAWHAFMNAADHLSDIHMELKNHLLLEDAEKVRNWQKETYHKQLIGGFRETKEFEDGFRKAQKPWIRRLKEVELSKKSYHQSCKEEHSSTTREAHARSDPSISQEQVCKLQDRAGKCKEESEKNKERYVKSLDELNRYNPRYIEDMEQVFENAQEAEKRRLRFFKEVFLDIHSHLDLSSKDNFRVVFRDLYQSILTASDQEDLKWWRNTHGPGMNMNWPQFEEWSLEASQMISRKERNSRAEDVVTLTNIVSAAETPPTFNRSVREYSSDWSDEESPKKYINTNGLHGEEDKKDEEKEEVGQSVKALYDYTGQEADELSFKAGEELMKIGEEDEQGWCKGRLMSGQVGLYPANYVEVIVS